MNNALFYSEQISAIKMMLIDIVMFAWMKMND